MAEPAQILQFPDGFRDGPFSYTGTGLATLSPPSFNDWQEAGRRLKITHRGAMWWLGDWLLAGERLFGQLAAQALDDFGYDYSTLQNAKRVAQAIEPERRRPELSFDHYLAVVSRELTPADQEQLLGRALAGDWNRDQLRRAVKECKLDKRRREAKGTAPRPAKADDDTSPDLPASQVDLTAGDFRAILPRFPRESVDLALCSPPQGEADIDTFADLACKVEPVLRPLGSLLLQVPIAHLHEVLRLTPDYLRFWWVLAAPGPAGYLEGKGISCSWRLWLWLVKGGRRGEGTIRDLLPEAPIRYLVERLTVDGEVILDPLCGTGEVLSACAGLDRALVGLDPDPANIDMARRRLGP